MNIRYYLENMDNNVFCSVLEGKNAETRIAEYLVRRKIIFFDNSSAYVKLRTHYEYISDDMVYSLIRSLISKDDRLNVRSYSIKEALERIKDTEELQIDFESFNNQNKLFINLKNGIYDINAQQLIPHDINKGFNCKRYQEGCFDFRNA